MVHLKLRKDDFPISDQFVLLPIKTDATILETTTEFQPSLVATNDQNYNSTNLQTFVPSISSSSSIDPSENFNEHITSMPPEKRQDMFKQPSEM